MNKIKRAVVWEIVEIFLFATAVALLLMTLGGGAKEGVSRGLPPDVVLRMLPFLVPEMLRFIVPGCLLYAICSVFGRMAAANEIVALKSLGINPMRIVWPVLVLAYMFSMFTYSLYDVCAVWSRPNLRRLVSESIDDIAYGFLRSNHAFTTRGLSIIVDGVEGENLLRPVVTIEAGGTMLPITLVAEVARLRLDPRSGSMRIECKDGQLEVAGKGSLRFPERFVQDILLGNLDVPQDSTLPPAALGTRSIYQQLALESSQIARLKKELQGSKKKESTLGSAPLEQELAYRQSRLFRLQAEPHRRLANGLGCLCFAMLGVPIAINRRSADAMSIFFVCFLPILLLYYPLLMAGETIAREGVLPQISVWLADAVLFVIGVLLLVRSGRH